MSGPFLLDANALIALTVSDHEHHERAVKWSADIARFALCPIVEGALVRFLIRFGHKPQTIVGLLAAIHESARFEFWPDDLSYRDVHLAHVVGHRQVTDAYLATLASVNGGMLATFDQGLADAFGQHVRLIP